MTGKRTWNEKEGRIRFRLVRAGWQGSARKTRIRLEEANIMSSPLDELALVY